MNNVTAEHAVVNVASTSEELRDIQTFRYEVYAAEVAMDLPGLDHVRRILADPLDKSAVHLTAKFDNVVAGAVRLNRNEVPSGLETSLRTASLPKPFVYCSRLYIVKGFRGKGAVNDLAAACFDFFREEDAAVAICHCYPHLFNLYERMGFRRYGTPFVLPGFERFGPQTPFRCLLNRQRTKLAA